MALSVNTNVSSLNSQRALSSSQSSLSTSMQRLSSGLRVNSAKDDASGLAIAERMNAKIKGMNVAIRNANDGISMAQTADSALGKISDSLQRMRELAVQSANGTNSCTDRDNLQKEFTELQREVIRVVSGTQFNNNMLFTSTFGTGQNYQNTVTFQVGADNVGTDQIDVTTDDLTSTTTAPGLGAVYNSGTAGAGVTIDGTTSANALAAISSLDTAIDDVTKQRANYGAVQNRFDAAISNLQSASENTSAARSRIMDADFATETSNLSRAQILQQASMSMVAQANQAPQQVMKLLG